MKNAACKERVTSWLRLAVSLNLDKQKMFSHTPIASDGFILNYIDLLLQLCKPFTSNFAKYPTFISKINCFYLMSDDQITKGLELEKLVNNKEGLLMMMNGERTREDCSGYTADCVHETSSLLGGGDNLREKAPPNFITECFFLVHIAISFMTKKMSDIYMKNNEELNKAIGAKDYQMFDQIMAARLCMDAHIFGKNTNHHYKMLFTFTHALHICTG